MFTVEELELLEDPKDRIVRRDISALIQWHAVLMSNHSQLYCHHVASLLNDDGVWQLVKCTECERLLLPERAGSVACLPSR